MLKKVPLHTDSFIEKCVQRVLNELSHGGIFTLIFSKLDVGVSEIRRVEVNAATMAFTSTTSVQRCMFLWANNPLAP